MKKINLALVDDHQIVRSGIKELLKEQSYIKIMFEAESGSALIRELNTRKRHPEIIILDLEMPDMNGFQTAKWLKEHHPEIRIIVLTMHLADEIIIDLIKIGVDSYLDKDTSNEALVKAIEKVGKGEVFHSARVSKVLASSIRSRKRKHTFNDNVKFSDLELLIVDLVCKEKKNAEISEIVCRSVSTVETIKKGLFEKMGVISTAGIVKFAIKNNLVSI